MRISRLLLAPFALLLGCQAREGEQVAVASSDDSLQSNPALAKADLSRIQGNPNAKTWFVIVSDFQCPYCKQWHDSASAVIRREYVETGKIRVAYVHFPLGQHRHAVPTAEAAMCAGVEDKFWAYHDALFETQARWQGLQDATPILDSLARVVGLNVAEHKMCRDKHVMLPLISADRERADNAGAQSTPTFLVGGQVLKGVYPVRLLRQVLNTAIAADSAR
ncbi:MAG TPA: thioredoxin domain-containing protein [Gemmatimonadaceae bacterium]|nr:thioredoxin domain-containing protein [Gemmatimonadaceae bacterium]